MTITATFLQEIKETLSVLIDYWSEQVEFAPTLVWLKSDNIVVEIILVRDVFKT